jgi:ribonuclease BN (tRNA processing enzyme)
MGDGITVKVLGDFGPFSSMGKSIGYEVIVGESSYLVDCGSPLFQQIGGEGLKKIKGLIVTHCHDDHKRWFTDLALFKRYTSDARRRILFITSEEVNDEIVSASSAALDRTLSDDSKKVVDVAYEDYVRYQIIGPRAKYHIVSVDEGRGKTGLYIKDWEGNIVDPGKAKIIISNKSRRARMLFKDPDYREWIEPSSFYPFSSNIFYEESKNIFRDEEEGLTIQAVKEHAWHGIPVIGVKIQAGEDTLIFSSDTINDVNLWKDLCTEKYVQTLNMSQRDFESASVIYGDINDFIERVWSEERYKEAVETFADAIVIHDVCTEPSAVHTDYRLLQRSSLNKDRAILTHSPDRITSEWALCDREKSFKIKGKKFSEIVGDKLYPMNADIYYKENGRYLVGYRNEKGSYTVYDKDGFLSLSNKNEPDIGTPLFDVDLYEDISGKYFPTLGNKNVVYRERNDGEVEMVEFTDKGSTGRIVENHRDRLKER